MAGSVLFIYAETGEKGEGVVVCDAVVRLIVKGLVALDALDGNGGCSRQAFPGWQHIWEARSGDGHQ